MGTQKDTKLINGLTDKSSDYHIPVLLNETIAGLNINDPRYPISFSLVKNNIANAYYRTNQLPAALKYAKQAIENDTKNLLDGFFIVNSLLLAEIYAAMNETDSALRNYRFVNTHTPYYAQNIAARAGAGMARIFQKQTVWRPKWKVVSSG